MAPQILVAFIDPIGAGRSEYIKIHRIFQRLGLVRHVRRDAEDLSGMHHDFLAADPELQRTIEDVSELFVVVAVLGNDASPFRSTRANIISWPTTNCRCSSGFRSSSGILCQGMY